MAIVETLVPSIKKGVQWRRLAPLTLVTAGLAWVLVATLDPARPSGAVGGPVLCSLALLLTWRSGQLGRPWVVATILSTALAVGVWAHPDLRRGDFRPLFVYLRSVAFDHDLDFANEYQAWGLPVPPLTPTGHRINMTTVGPALLWSPFFAAAHAYVLLDIGIGAARYRPDGNSVPYLRSTLAGTVTAVVLGAALLVSVLERRLGRRIAVLATVGAVTTSPLLVYTFAEPGVAHGGAFALACAGIWAVDRARLSPSLATWLLVGAIAGFMVLMRLQGFVFGLLAVPLAVDGLARRTVRPLWLVGAVLIGALAVSPQLVAWKVIYGQWLTAGGALEQWSADSGRSGDVIFRPGRILDPTSPHLQDVLFSADRGLFSWTPGCLLAFCAFLFGLRRWGLLGVGGLLVCVATAWFNGSYTLWWSAGDAFGARRFDMAIPFLALGYASLLAFLARMPLLTPTLVLVSITLWNIGLANLWRTAVAPEAAALDEMASLQAHQLRRLAEGFLGGLFGAGGRALGYNYFVGRFFFVNSAADGVIDVGALDPKILTGAWSPPRNEAGPPSFRLVFPPRACARIPLLRPVDLTARITAQSATKREVEMMKVTANGVGLQQVPLGPDWTESVVPFPASAQVPGENLLCLEFEPRSDSAPRPAARVRRIVVH
jgi:hypothetical protein